MSRAQRPLTRSASELDVRTVHGWLLAALAAALIAGCAAKKPAPVDERSPAAAKPAPKAVPREADTRPATYTFRRGDTLYLCLINIANRDGWLPWKNLQYGGTPLANNMSGETHSKTVLKHREGCYARPICCRRFTSIKDGRWAGEEFGGPEYEHAVPTGPRVGIIEDANDIWHNARLTNDLGMDGIETGAVISAAMEWYQRGLITAKIRAAWNLSGVRKGGRPAH